MQVVALCQQSRGHVLNQKSAFTSHIASMSSVAGSVARATPPLSLTQSQFGMVRQWLLVHMPNLALVLRHSGMILILRAGSTAFQSGRDTPGSLTRSRARLRLCSICWLDGSILFGHQQESPTSTVHKLNPFVLPSYPTIVFRSHRQAQKRTNSTKSLQR